MTFSHQTIFRLCAVSIFVIFEIRCVNTPILEGNYIRSYSPGYSGEMLVFSSDSLVEYSSWKDVELEEDPSRFITAVAGRYTISGERVNVSFYEIRMDETRMGLEVESTDMDTRNQLNNRVLEAAQSQVSEYFIKRVDDTTVLVRTADLSFVETCQRMKDQTKPKSVLDGLEFEDKLAESCGQLFFPVGNGNYY